MMDVRKKADVADDEYKMKCTSLRHDKKQNLAVYELSGVTVPFVNSLRRTIIEEVPTMAIETVEIANNYSALYDEMLALRLGLIPLTTDLESYNLLEECDCNGEGCAKCSCKLTLKEDGVGYIMSESLHSKDKAIKPAYNRIPITKLVEEQSVELIATAVLGKGKVHAKWSPGHAYYHLKPVVTIKKHDKETYESLPKKYFDYKSSKISLKEEYAYDLTVLDSLVESYPEVLSLELKQDSFIFYIESWGQLETDTILRQAISIMEKKLDTFSALLGKLE